MSTAARQWSGRHYLHQVSIVRTGTNENHDCLAGHHENIMCVTTVKTFHKISGLVSSEVSRWHNSTKDWGIIPVSKKFKRQLTAKWGSEVLLYTILGSTAVKPEWDLRMRKSKYITYTHTHTHTTTYTNFLMLMHALWSCRRLFWFIRKCS